MIMSIGLITTRLISKALAKITCKRCLMNCHENEKSESSAGWTWYHDRK
jgi:hypothetical protein